VRRHGLVWAGLVLASVVGLPLITPVPLASASAPLPPGQDPFYTYSGSKPLASIAPGTVLNHRTVELSLGTTTATPVQAEQLLYRTTGQQNEPIVTVTTVLTPTPVPVLPRIVEYLSFYDGLGAQCDPSYTLAGGDPGAANQQEADEEELLISWYLSQGDIVTVPDFEGEGLHWMAGRESGYGALDAVRATESFLGVLPDSTPVGLSGYSGGAVASDWASELAPAYASELDLVGVAEGGIPVNDAHLFAYVDGTVTYSAAIPGILIGLSRAYGWDLQKLDTYLSPYGKSVAQQEDQVCIGSVFGKYPGLTMKSIMKPPYQNLLQVPVFAAMLGDQTMGTASTHPVEPLFMAVGNADGTGDGAMVAADVASLARQYCHEGVPVEFQEYQGATHEDAGALFEPQTGPFLQDRLAGAPYPSNCASLG